MPICCNTFCVVLLWNPFTCADIFDKSIIEITNHSMFLLLELQIIVLKMCCEWPKYELWSKGNSKCAGITKEICYRLYKYPHKPPLTWSVLSCSVVTKVGVPHSSQSNRPCLLRDQISHAYPFTGREIEFREFSSKFLGRIWLGTSSALILNQSQGVRSGTRCW